MLQKINKAIAQYGMWIFLVAALYKFIFWIIDMVSSFKLSGGYGVRTMFSGLFGMVLDLVILAVILEVSRKIAEKYTPADFANNSFNPTPGGYNPTPANNFNAQMPTAQTPAPQIPTPAQTTPTNSVWFCSDCGTQNDGATAFCSKCGKPK